MSFGHVKKIGCTLLCASLVGSTVLAQNPPTTQPVPRQDSRAGQQQGSSQHESLLASCLVHDNQAEVALSRMAQEKSQSEAVKKFAGMMVEDHQAFLTKIQKYAPNAGELSANQSGSSDRSGASGQNNPGQNNPGQTPGQTPGVNQNPNQTGAFPRQATAQSTDMAGNVAQIQKEIAQQCLSDAQEKLSKVDKDEFDKCYVGMQLAMHAGMKSKLTVFARHASGEMKQLVDQAMETTTSHLKKAESLMEDIEEKSNSGSSEGGKKERSTSSEKSENR